MLFIIWTLIVLTGAVLYYLIYTNSQELVSLNTVEKEENFDSENTTVAEIIGNVIETTNSVTIPNVPNNSTVTTTDATNRKVQNKNLVVLYDGLLLDVSEMKQVELKYIESTNFS